MSQQVEEILGLSTSPVDILKTLKTVPPKLITMLMDTREYLKVVMEFVTALTGILTVTEEAITGPLDMVVTADFLEEGFLDADLMEHLDLVEDLPEAGISISSSMTRSPWRRTTPTTAAEAEISGASRSRTI